MRRKAQNAAEGRRDGARRAGAKGAHGNPPADGTRLVAVYGTLMEGEPNARWRGGVPTVARGTVLGRLYDTGWGFPELQPDLGGDPVRVEVLATDDAGVARMDRLEGYPDLYGRERVLVTVSRNRTLDCEVYVMREDRRPSGETRIGPNAPRGVVDWRIHRRTTRRD